MSQGFYIGEIRLLFLLLLSVDKQKGKKVKA